MASPLRLALHRLPVERVELPLAHFFGRARVLVGDEAEATRLSRRQLHDDVILQGAKLREMGLCLS